jgi:hypothetical protein
MKRTFRIIENKSGCKAIRNVDYVYLINLDQRPEKLARTLRQLEPFSIRPERVEAVYGWNLPKEAVIGMALAFGAGMDGGHRRVLQPVPYPGVTPMRPLDASCYGQPCFYPRTSLGAIGTAMSHLAILQDAWRQGYETIWVLEDDVVVSADPRILSRRIEELDGLEKDWDLMYTDDVNYFDEPFTPGTVWRPDAPDIAEPFLRRASGPFFQISGRSQMHSVILRRSGVGKILEFEAERGLFLPYDIDAAFVPGLKMFNLNEKIVWGGIWSQEISDTDFQHFGQGARP